MAYLSATRTAIAVAVDRFRGIACQACPRRDAESSDRPAFLIRKRDMLFASSSVLLDRALQGTLVVPVACAGMESSNTGSKDILFTVRRVGSSFEYPTITSALESANSGDVIELEAGASFRERLIITKPVSVRSASSSPHRPAAVVWDTKQPYESTIEIAADGVSISDLTIHHSSPSIASNYAIKCIDCLASIENCDVSSSTGTAVGIEGGVIEVTLCNIHDCKRNGVIIVPTLEGHGGISRIEGCNIVRNGLHGVLVRDGASAIVRDNCIADNGGFGLALQEAGGEYSGNNSLTSNTAGAIAVHLLAEELDELEMARENHIRASDVYARQL